MRGGATDDLLGPDRVVADRTSFERPGLGVPAWPDWPACSCPNVVAPADQPELPILQAATILEQEDGAFLQGYRDYGGNPAWEAHWLLDVLPCESGHWGQDWYANGYRSRAQFHPGSWATASAITGQIDGSDPYAVGANVAAWSNLIAHPGSTAGWPTCWWRGVVL